MPAQDTLAPSPPPPDERREAIRRIVRQVEERLLQDEKLLRDFEADPDTLDQIEEQSERIGEHVKHVVSEQALRRKEAQDQKRSGAQTCRACGKTARYAGQRQRTLVLRSGTHCLWRGYYHCRGCHGGFAPLDEALGIGAGPFSRRLTALMARLSAYLPDRLVVREMGELFGVDVSASTVQRHSHAVGQQIKQKWERSVEQMRQRRLPPSTERPSRLHTSTDGVMLHIGGGWHAVKTGCVFETDREGRAVKARYYASQVDSARFGPRLRVLAHTGGMDRCADVAAVADGAAWIWQELGKHFPQSVQILDFVHATQHLWEMARARYGEGGKQAQAWMDVQTERLKADGVAQVLTEVQSWKPRQEAKVEIRRRLIGYLTEHQGRMRYGTFSAAGYQIGSGVNEACNKNVVQARMKRAGMRWQEPRAESVLHLCAWYHSHGRPDITQYIN
jgi:hypothetical protein